VTCGKLKLTTGFAAGYSKRCLVCVGRAETATCRACGGPAGVNCKGDARTYCDNPACIREQIDRAVVTSVEARRKRVVTRKRKRCASCTLTKPLDEFGPAKRENGVVVRHDSYCKECRRADSRDRYSSSPERRAQNKAACARRRKAELERRAVDPVYNEQVLARKRVTEARRRARLASPVPEREEIHHAGGSRVPALPLVAFIDREANHLQEGLNGRAPSIDTTLEKVCDEWGVQSRRLRDWRGPGAQVTLDVVDRVLTNAGVLWFDVYDEERYPAEHEKAAEVFVGPAR
jgi:hypothetical protein